MKIDGSKKIKPNGYAIDSTRYKMKIVYLDDKKIMDKGWSYFLKNR